MGAKNCPETARQKMINMMYLVLLAMMALNVASEVLSAFKVVDASLLQTYESLKKENEQLYASFHQAYELNQDKVRPWLNSATEVKTSVDSLIKEIYDIKEEIVLRANGINLSDFPEEELGEKSFIVNYTGDTIAINKDDELNVPAEVMIRLGRGEELKVEIEDLKQQLIAIVGENSSIAENLERDLDTSDPKSTFEGGGEVKTWEVDNFEGKPLIAVMTILSNMQIDIQNAESSVLNYLYGQIDAGSFKFNKLGAVVIANSSYVLEGDVYHAEVFLAAEDSTQHPEIFVNGSPLRIENGKGIYERPANTQGEFKWDGEIHYKTPEGNINIYPFEESYQVSKPSVTVSPTKMNLFYLKIANPVSVSVPGVPSENLTVRMTNGTIEKVGNTYNVYPEEEDINGNNTSITVYALINGENRNMGTLPFRVKRVPDPIATIAEENGGDIRKERLLVEDGIFAELVDFDFDLKFTVTQFDLTITGSTGYTNTWSSNSNRFTDEQKQQFQNISTGNIIYFDNIIAHGDDGTDRELSPISFKIR